LEQVLSYFNDAFGKPAHKVSDGTFVYTDRSSSDESVTLVLSVKQQKIALTLYTRGEPGVNYLREFFEAPFFRRSESEHCTPSLIQITIPASQNSADSK
jgi:hypothetical protein